MVTTFKEYQDLSRKFAIYPKLVIVDETGAPISRPSGLAYVGLGLAGEAGEVAEKVKKTIRDTRGRVSMDAREALKKELGDVLWYVSQLATEVGLSLDDVARGNLKKLEDRMDRGALCGSGDNR